MRCSSDRELLTAVCEEIVKSRRERLLVKNRDLYVEYDRTLSEVDLRAALLLPGVLLLIGLELNLAWPTWAKVIMGVAVVGILVAVLLHSRMLEKLGHSMYAHAVADRLVSTPALDALDPPLTTGSRPHRPTTKHLPLGRGKGLQQGIRANIQVPQAPGAMLKPPTCRSATSTTSELAAIGARMTSAKRRAVRGHAAGAL